MTEFKKVHVAESCHWYDTQGNPVYEVPSADGRKMVKTTLRHARKMNLVPGVTAILSCAAKPGLETWKIQQGILAALTLPRFDGESDQDFLARVMEDSKRQAQEAADRGTEIHAMLERWYGGEEVGPLNEDDSNILDGVATQVASVCGEQEWEAERSFAHPFGYGSKADLVSHDWLIDFKGSDFDQDKAQTLKTWPEHWMQLAATHAGLRESDDHLRRCLILYFSRSHPGIVQPVEVSQAELSKGWEMFCCLHGFWCAQRDYYPGFDE